MSTTWTLPVPNSWYGVAFSDELPPGAVLRRELAGQQIVLYRAQSGQPSAIDAYCPHLGAHLGYGGTVEGEELRCPFHGFRFALDGSCTATGYGTRPPPTARLKRYPLCEVNGILFVYYDSRGRSPSWDIPALEADGGWTPIRHRTFELRDHPQETVENGVDIGHFGIVHGYSAVEMLRDMVIDGPCFRVMYAARRPMPVLGRFGVTVGFEFELEIYGMGCSLVHVRVPEYDLYSRLFVLAVPTRENRINLHLGLSQRIVTQPGRIHPLLAPLPRRPLSNLIAYFVHNSLIHDARQDFVIWENKRYVQPPALAEGDGPVGRFRQWARQFYYPDELAVQQEGVYERSV
jgi:nitrite reductase/ring-hydroxylating ferredoxin subunit